SGRNPGPSGPFHGTAVWVHRPGAAESERIGLYDESYTRKDLQKISYFDDVNDNGLVVGRSEFPIDVAPMSNTAAWIYDSATGQTKEIGLANPLDGKANRDMFTQLTASNHAV